MAAKTVRLQDVSATFVPDDPFKVNIVLVGYDETNFVPWQYTTELHTDDVTVETMLAGPTADDVTFV